MFSIIIPTWNNLPYLKLCIGSIQKNSFYQHQIVVHINDGSDGTLHWVREQKIEHSYSPENVGICVAVNEAAGFAKKDYIVYMNDDMYVCPDWDKIIFEEIEKTGTRKFMFSSTLIEPANHNNPCVIHKNFGDSLDAFDEDALLKEYNALQKSDWYGSAWPPTIVHKLYWNIVGGYSIEFSPGMSSDDDFAMKMWNAGCRIFKGIGDSRVYHFQAKSTLRVKKNNGRKQFLMKWGINQSTFNKYFIKRGIPYNGILEDVNLDNMKWEQFRAWFKRKIM